MALTPYRYSLRVLCPVYAQDHQLQRELQEDEGEENPLLEINK